MISLGRGDDARTASFDFGRLLAKRTQHFRWGEGELAEPNPDRVVNGVRERGNRRMQRSLAGFFCAVRAFGIEALDDQRSDFRRVERGRNRIIEQRWTSM